MLNPWLSLMSYFIVFVATLEFISNEKQIRWIMYAIVTAGAIVGFLAIIQSITGKTIFTDFLGGEMLRRSGALTSRAVGTADNPNTGALVPVIALPLALALWQLPSLTGFQRIWALSSTILIGGHLLLSFSRSAWIGFVFSLILLFWLVGLRNILRLLPIILVLILVLSFLAPVEAIYDRIGFFSSPEYSLAGRLHVYRSLPRILWKRGLGALIGTGAGTSTDVIGRATGYRIAPHNAFIAVLLEAGIMGLAVYVWMLFSVYRSTILYSKIVSNESRIIQAGLLASIVAWQIHCLFHSYLHWAGGWMALALLVRYNLLVVEKGSNPTHF
jgi:O-antigen ligase